MLKRVTLAIGVLGVLGSWVGTGALAAAGASKAYVGLFKDDAVAVIDTVQNRVLTTISVPERAAWPRHDARRPQGLRQQ
jgi:YVTN family beta-propeller protein